MVMTQRAHMLLACAMHHLKALTEEILVLFILIAYLVSFG